AIYIVTAGDVGEDLEQMLLDGGVARLKENPLAVIVWNGRAVPVTVAGEPVGMGVEDMLRVARTARTAPRQEGIQPGVNLQAVGVRLLHDLAEWVEITRLPGQQFGARLVGRVVPGVAAPSHLHEQG